MCPGAGQLDSTLGSGVGSPVVAGGMAPEPLASLPLRFALTFQHVSCTVEYIARQAYACQYETSEYRKHAWHT